MAEWLRRRQLFRVFYTRGGGCWFGSALVLVREASILGFRQLLGRGGDLQSFRPVMLSIGCVSRWTMENAPTVQFFKREKWGCDPTSRDGNIYSLATAIIIIITTRHLKIQLMEEAVYQKCNNSHCPTPPVQWTMALCRNSSFGSHLRSALFKVLKSKCSAILSWHVTNCCFHLSNCIMIILTPTHLTPPPLNFGGFRHSFTTTTTLLSHQFFTLSTFVFSTLKKCFHENISIV